jgi:superfamily II DNA/RNA helicase
VFSEWTTTLDLIEKMLDKAPVKAVRLDGSVPQKKRAKLVDQFQSDPDCRFFLTTNAGSVGLNLQAANTIVNVDLPWNPAILEQRIARAHRMGQKRPVHVILLVTQGTIEENMLGTLSMKKNLSLAVLDPHSDVTEVDMQSGIDELKNRLEILLGKKPPAPPDVRSEQIAAQSAARAQRQKQIANAGGQMLQSAFQFLGHLLPAAPDNNAVEKQAELLAGQLQECLQADEEGGFELKLKLESQEALKTLSNSLARIALLAGQGSGV